MKVLITGALKLDERQKDELTKSGMNIIGFQNEMDRVNFDVSDIDAVICNSLFLYNDIKMFKKLKYIQVTSAGLDRLPLDYIEKNDIQVFNARGVYSIPIAEWTVSKILEIYKNSYFFYENKKEKKWEKNRNIIELNGKKVTIIGYGDIGNEIAKRLKAFNTNIIAVDLFEKKNEHVDQFYNIINVEKAIQDSDINILTLPLTKDTYHFIDKKIISKMKDGCILVNVSRGKIVNEEELIEAVRIGKFSGVVLDVFENEPLNKESEMWNFNNVIVTPHNSFVGENNNERLFRVVKNNLSGGKR